MLFSICIVCIYTYSKWTVLSANYNVPPENLMNLRPLREVWIWRRQICIQYKTVSEIGVGHPNLSFPSYLYPITPFTHQEIVCFSSTIVPFTIQPIETALPESTKTK